MVDLFIREPFVDRYKFNFCDLEILFLVGFIYVGFYVVHFYFVLASQDSIEPI